MPQRFKINHAGIARILKGKDAQAATDAKARQAAAFARSIAPVRSGDYQASIDVAQAPTPNRARSVVRAQVPYALAVEARDNVLAKALNSVRE
jgi:hypothetical protein